jgi:hypothetical protein
MRRCDRPVRSPVTPAARASAAIASVGATSALCAAALAFAGLSACKRPRELREPPQDAPRARRVIEPSTDRVGPLPPYAIRSDGVGPYKLGEKLSSLLEQLASGPRIALFEIPGVVHLNVIRAEDDTILIGGEQASTASLVAVVGPDVARTESGVHVGSTRDELVLGPASDDPDRARDPRLVLPSASPNIRAVLDGDRVAAIVVARATSSPRHASDCHRPAASDGAIGACMTPAGELIQIAGDEIAFRSPDGERALVPPAKFPGLVFAAPLRTLDGRDELAVITRSDQPAARSWSLAAVRIDGARLVRTVDPALLYQLSAANARWIGADLRDIELYLELTSRADGIDVGGLLTTRGTSRDAAIRDVVVIAPIQVPHRRGKPPAGEASDAPAGSASPARVTHDAAVDAPGSTEAEIQGR